MIAPTEPFSAQVPSAGRMAGARPRAGVIVGIAILIALTAFSLLTPLVVDGSPTGQNLAQTLQPPGPGHRLGTDHLGRDMALRLAAAIRVSLSVSIGATIVAAVLGVGLGVLAGSRGGLVDRLLSTAADMVLALPGLLLVLLIIAIAPGRFWPLYLGISLVLWIEYFRMARAITIRVAASPAVQASQLLGFGPVYVFLTHYWPQMAPMILTVGAFGAATAILSVAALGFVNVGIRPPTPELGQMMIELLPYYHEAPYIIAQPILVVFLLVLSLNLIAGGKAR
ncbi:peptide/nickel transport system permease protein [Tepidamorphus gemmatus]|uniref:Peptide/nickel transport system permease protein n=1 Tax=Tepidamorphus gemmatus TaxID=747076 RepID=A0A4V2UY98_9HYPH|nr:peptide/nickel transport system permease protein [Tepidamorphus gemmatus]